MRVLVFTKFPTPGRVKTRLAADIGAVHAAALQQTFVRDELATLRALHADVTLCCDPDAPLSAYQDLYGPVTCAAQHGADLGNRMLHALRLGAGPVLLIGSDLPDLPAAHLQAAWQALHEVPVCLGPSPDGGFHLIGTRHALPIDIFDGVTWSTDSVLERTLFNLGRHQLTHRVLPPWADVDTIEDLAAYARRSVHAATRTMAYIRQHRLVEDAWKN